jgi:hypothetical protein
MAQPKKFEKKEDAGFKALSSEDLRDLRKSEFRSWLLDELLYRLENPFPSLEEIKQAESRHAQPEPSS